MKNIVLIGFMGTGKSAVGRQLAKALKLEFIDTDAEIECLMGKTVTQIFAEDGVGRFRYEEEMLVKRLAGHVGLVIATGGGMVLNPVNLNLLKENGVLVALTASPDIIYNRVNNVKTRPLLLSEDIKGKIEELLKERENAYKAAEITIDTGVSSIEKAVEQIIRYLLEKEYIHC